MIVGDIWIQNIKHVRLRERAAWRQSEREHYQFVNKVLAFISAN